MDQNPGLMPVKAGNLNQLPTQCASSVANHPACACCPEKPAPDDRALNDRKGQRAERRHAIYPRLFIGGGHDRAD